MGGVIILTRGMGERLTYGIPGSLSCRLWWNVWEACSSLVGAPVPKMIRVCTAAVISR